jgi:hypothetical protein
MPIRGPKPAASTQHLGSEGIDGPSSSRVWRKLIRVVAALHVAKVRLESNSIITWLSLIFCRITWGNDDHFRTRMVPWRIAHSPKCGEGNQRYDSMTELIHLLTFCQNSYWDQLSRLEDFPETPEDAQDLLSIARCDREACNHRKLAVEHAVQRTITHLKVLKRKTPSDEYANLLTGDLQELYQELLKLDDELLEADKNVGAVRSTLGRKGLPVELHPGQLYEREAWGLDPPNEFQVDDSSSETSNIGDESGSEESP